MGRKRSGACTCRPGHTKRFRFKNIRVDTSLLGANPVLAFLAISGTAAVSVTNPTVLVAQPLNAITTSVSPAGYGFYVSVTENYPAALRDRNWITSGGLQFQTTPMGIPHGIRAGKAASNRPRLALASARS